MMKPTKNQVLAALAVIVIIVLYGIVIMGAAGFTSAYK